MKTRPLHLLALLLSAVSLAAEEPAPRALDDVLSPIREKHGLPGLAAAVVTPDGLRAIGAVGKRRAGGEDAIETSDLWHLGSCTKAMTATLVARLVERGTLKWEMTLGEALPKLKDAMDPAWAGVTLAQLLSNRGGAPAGLERDGLWGKLWAHKGTAIEARRLLVAGVVKHPPEYEPGTKFLYSNANFAMAGHVAEALGGASWEELMLKEVFAPLGIEGAGFGAPGRAGEKADQPRGHGGNGKAVEPGPGSDNPVAIGPAGIVHMSLADWGKFVTAHLRGARGERVDGADGKPFLGADSWKKLHTPPGDGYAMGWGVAVRPAWAKGAGREDTGRVLSHNGSNTMWYCVVWIAPEKGFAVLVATNAAGDAGAKGTDDAAAAVIREWLGK